MIFRKKTLRSFENIEYSMSGMRFSHTYKIRNDGETAAIALYNRFNEEKGPLAEASCPAHEMLDALNRFGAGNWDGFHGKHPRGVLDGIMFSFKAKVNGEEEIHADGSQNFPKGFRDFTSYVDGLLRETEKEQEK